MAGYYDPNKDYSKAISEAKAAGKDTSQLEAERQNKIDDKYGGKEPNMWGSDKTYSQSSRDNDRDTIGNAISISNGRGSSSSASNGNRNTGGSSSSTSGNRVTNLPGNAQPAQAAQTPLAPAQLPALNQYGYRDMDYTTAIQNATSAAERAQLLQERANKIQYQYGGVEPNMIGSNQKFSKTLAGSSSGQASGLGAVGSTKELVKGPGYVTGGYTMGVNGSPILNDNPYWKGGVSASKADMSRRPDLANGYATSNGYTVFYDEDGYATKAIKGVADYTPHQDINAGNGTYNSAGAWTDNEMLTEADRKKIENIRAQMQAGQITGDQANQLANQIRSGYGYTIDKQGNVTDLGALSSVDARRQAWGLPTNGVSSEMQNFLQLMYPELQTSDPNALLAAQYALTQGTYNPQTVYTAPAAQTLTAVSPYAGGSVSNIDLGSSFGSLGGDASQYLQEMYAQQIAAQLAALKSTYEQNVADIQAQDDLITSTYDKQRNQAAAQNDLQRMQMNELGLMQGLNTGASGQMALAQSAALQGNLATIGSQEAQSLADNALNLTKLTAQYKNAADQAAAEGNAQLASALYNEYVRQQELALQQQAAAQEQANWEAKMAYQQQQDALAQQNWQAQFDYQKAQDDLNYQLTLQKLYGSSAGNTGSTVRTRTPVKAPSVGYNNGNLTNEQVKVLQNHYGVTADGLWGKNSSNAAGGLTAAQAWDAFQSGPLKSIEQSVGMNRTSTGQANAIQKALQAGSITEAQAEAMLRKFGIM